MDRQNIETRPGDAERPQEPGAASPSRGGRMSRQRKVAAVLRLVRGEDLELVSRSLGVTAATLTAWRDAFLSAGEAALTTKPSTGEELEGDRLWPAATGPKKVVDLIWLHILGQSGKVG